MEEDPRAYRYKDATPRGYECLSCDHKFMEFVRSPDIVLSRTFITSKSIEKVEIDCPKCGSHEGKRIGIDKELFDDFLEQQKHYDVNSIEECLKALL